MLMKWEGEEDWKKVGECEGKWSKEGECKWKGFGRYRYNTYFPLFIEIKKIHT